MDAEHTEILAKIAIPLRELVNHLQGAVDSARLVSQSVDHALKAPDVQATPWTVKFRHATRGVNIAETKMPEVPPVGAQLTIVDEATGLCPLYEVTEVKSEPHRMLARCMVKGPIELPPEAVLPESVSQDTSHPAASGSPLDESVEKAKAAGMMAANPLAYLYFCENAICPGHVYGSLDCEGKGYICAQGCAPGHSMGKEDCYGGKWWRKTEPVPGAPMTDKEMGEIGQFDSSDESHE